MPWSKSTSVVFTELTSDRTMRLGLKGRIAKIFNQVFVGGVGDIAWRGHNSTVIEDVTGGLTVTAHAVFIISQSHSVVVSVKPAVSRAQVVKLDPCFARHVASWPTKARRYPVLFLSWPQYYRPNFHSPADFREILGVCQRRLHIFCWPRESTQPCLSRKKLWGVLREYGVDDRLLLVVKSRNSCSEGLCPCRSG